MNTTPESLRLMFSRSITAKVIVIAVLLQMEDFTLLIGNIGLFVMLAVMMFVSRKINWYGTEEVQ